MAPDVVREGRLASSLGHVDERCDGLARRVCQRVLDYRANQSVSAYNQPSSADEFCHVDFLETLIGLNLGPHAGDLLRSKFDPISCRRPDYAAGQVVAGAHSGPWIGTGRQNDTDIKFDGLRRFQRDLADFFEWHRHLP
jgi:hypothetical protein